MKKQKRKPLEPVWVCGMEPILVPDDFRREMRVEVWFSGNRVTSQYCKSRPAAIRAWNRFIEKLRSGK